MSRPLVITRDDLADKKSKQIETTKVVQTVSKSNALGTHNNAQFWERFYYPKPYIEESFEKLKKELFYEKKTYVYSDKILFQIRQALQKRFKNLYSSKFVSSIYTILTEMIANALKATHKKVYYNHIIRDLKTFMPVSKITDEKCLFLFKQEIHDNHYKNLKALTMQKKYSITVLFKAEGSGFMIYVINFGVPYANEMKRIKSIIEYSKKIQALYSLFEKNCENSKLNEGAGLGLGLIVMTLKSLNILPENFQIMASGNKTTASLRIPWGSFNQS